MNPFQRFYDRCNTGDPLGKYARLADFPCIIDVEPVSHCNFRCLMCPTGNLSLSRPAEFMTRKTMMAVVRQSKKYDVGIRFIGWGEPTLHPDLPEFIWLCGTKNIVTHLNTNGSKIDEAYARKLVEAGLNSIKFSFQGVDRDSYAAMRQTDFFEGVLKAAEIMRSVRPGDVPWIAISTTTTHETHEQIGAFVARAVTVADQVSVGKTTFDYMDVDAIRKNADLVKAAAAMETVEKRHPDPCPEVFDKLSVHVDGTVVVCCNDFQGVTNLGNVNKVKLNKIWRHKVIEEYRKRLARKEYEGPLCEFCYDYLGTTNGGVEGG